MTPLLPCPHCGGKAEPAGVAEMRWVRCIACRAEGGDAETDEAAAEKWNARVPSV